MATINLTTPANKDALILASFKRVYPIPANWAGTDLDWIKKQIGNYIATVVLTAQKQAAQDGLVKDDSLVS